MSLLAMRLSVSKWVSRANRAPEREMRSSTRRTSLLHMCCIICLLKIRSAGPGSWVSETTSACTRRVMLSRLTRLVSITFLTMSRPMYEMACRAQPHYCYDETVRCGAGRDGAGRHRNGRGMTGVRRAWRLRCARACFCRSLARAWLEKQPSPTGRSK